MTFAKKSLGQNFLIDENIINKISSLIKIEDLTLYHDCYTGKD